MTPGIRPPLYFTHSLTISFSDRNQLNIDSGFLYTHQFGLTQVSCFRPPSFNTHTLQLHTISSLMADTTTLYPHSLASDGPAQCGSHYSPNPSLSSWDALLKRFQTPWTRHPRFYFDDGNVIFLVRPHPAAMQCCATGNCASKLMCTTHRSTSHSSSCTATSSGVTPRYSARCSPSPLLLRRLRGSQRTSQSSLQECRPKTSPPSCRSSIPCTFSRFPYQQKWANAQESVGTFTYPN